MSSRVEKLFFRLDLIDRLTNPAGKVFKRFDSFIDKSKLKVNDLAQSAQRGFRNIAFGALGLVGAGHAIAGAMEPALEINRAMGEVQSLGVVQSELNQLKKTSLDFAEAYGESAATFISASYDIQSAIGGLANGELAAFTNASGVLAKATKSDASVITDYVGTMYGIFQTQADAMGKADWVNQLAGQTASAVQMFKTTGSEMAGAFSALGAGATSAGIAMHEQMAILGSLQATMSGSEAGTKYRAFLKGVGKAQDQLGLQFTDSQGRLLPMVDVLGAIRGKFGELDKVSELDALQKAFGSSEAVSLIQLLSGNVDGLTSSIGNLGNQKGMQKAQDMAKAMVDPWDQFAASVRNLRITMGDFLLPVLNPLIASMSAGLQTLRRWSGMFPNLSRVVGLAVLAILGFVGVMALLSIGAGLAQVVWGGMVITWTLLTPLVWGLKIAVVALRTAWFILNLAAMAFPALWLVLGIVALVAVVYMLVKHWETLIAAFKETEWFTAIQSALGWVSDKLDAIGNSKWFMGMVNAFNYVKNAVVNFVSFLANNNPLTLLGDGLSALGSALGLTSDDESISADSGGGGGASIAESIEGGIRGDMQNISKKGHHIENLTVVSPTAVNGRTLADELELA